MGVLAEEPKSIAMKNEGQTARSEHASSSLGEIKKSSLLQYQELGNSFDIQADDVEKLIYRLDKILEPIYHVGPVGDQNDTVKEEGFFGSTSVNQEMANHCHRMRSIRYKLEKILANITL